MLPAAPPERLSAFSDGVFAVLITVLVLDLRPPELPAFKALLLRWPTWLSYAVSYLFIAIVWANHHHHSLRDKDDAAPDVVQFRPSVFRVAASALDTGHFALETHAEEIAAAIRDFLAP
jgi:hypothetical protein